MLILFFLSDSYQTYSQSCSTYTCNPSLNLVCSSGSGTGCACPSNLGGSYCDCPTSKYWNGATCVNRVSNGVSCPTGQNYNCLYNSGLTCISFVCICDDANTYWDGSICRTYQTYYQSCSSYLCNPNYGLTCSSTANSCQCPTSMSSNYCDCPTTKYWNGALCVDRSTYNGACPTLQNYNCYSGKNLICSGGICDCLNSNYYWVSAIAACRK